MKENIFEEIPVATTNLHQCIMTVHHWMECYNIIGEPDDDDPLEINIPIIAQNDTSLPVTTFP